MKSGTTTVFEVLAQHSQIAPAMNKEPGFFAFDTIWEKGYQWYHSLFNFDPDRHIYRLEASTDYTKAPFVKNVWTRMCASPNKEFKLIYVMRDPIRRMESHARHTQDSRKELGQITSLRTSHSLDEGLSLLSMSTSQYAYQLSHFTDAIASNSIHFVLFEELCRDPKRVFSDLFSFLELGVENISDTLPQYNVAAEKKRLVPIWAQLSSNRSLTTAGRLIIPRVLRNLIKDSFRRKIKISGRFTFSQPEKEALGAFFNDDVSELSQKYGIRIPKEWKIPNGD